jgi:AcrR family transcriptional regulator
MPRQPTTERLSRDRILEAALQIVEREGLDALSMRRLAQALDVWPMSVYRYFQDKDALLDAMAATAAGEITPPSDADSWQDQLSALLHDAQRAISASAGIGGRLPRAFLDPEALKLSEAGVAILQSAGFTDAEAARAWHALWSYTFGFATFRLAPSADEAARRMRAAIAALPADDYPALTAAADELAAAFAADAEFDFGVRMVLEGLAASLTPAA